MKATTATKKTRRTRRHHKIRMRVVGVAARPRLSVYRSLTQVHGQIIDDSSGKTVVSVTTADEKGDAGERTGKIAQSYLGGKKLAALAQEKNIRVVTFDRGGFRYHGRVRAFAEGARDGGLEF